MTSAPTRLTIGSRGVPHHGAHAGYERLVAALRGKLAVRLVSGSRTRSLPPCLARRATGRTGMRWYNDQSLALELGVARDLLQRETCHLLYGEDTLYYSGLVRRLSTRGRLVATFHQPPGLFDSLVPDSRALQGLDAAIAMSRELRDHLAERLGAERAHFVRLGVDTVFFRPPTAPVRDPLSCLFVGWWQRDLEVLGAVVRRVRSRMPAVHFTTVVPPRAAGETWGATGIEPLVGISDAELLHRYQRAAVVVLPLKAAVANNVLLEAVSCGTPTVVTDVGGVRDYVDSACVELVPPADPDAMSDSLLALLNDPSRREQLGLKGRARALELDWEHIAEQHLRVYGLWSSPQDFVQ